jgi:hypothetical protein
MVLASVILVGCGGASTPRPATPVVPRPSPRPGPQLPGACVDPARDAVARLGTDADLEGLETRAEIDLDGDGTNDSFLTHPSFCGTGGCNWQLYVTRGSCGHFVGELFGLLPTAREGATAGLVELEIRARNGCGGMARTETRARFNGRFYAAAETRECRCPEPPEDEATDDSDPDKWCEPWRRVAE